MEERGVRVDKLEKTIKRLITWGGWIVSVIIGLWSLFGLYYNFKTDINDIRKLTLRNTIWNETIPMHDRLESCDNYIKLGFNSETKKYCEELLKKDIIK
jgi:hypothetical protein